MISKDFKKLQNSPQDFKRFFDTYSKEEISKFFSSESGECLGNHSTGSNKPVTTGGIPDIRRIYGASLKALSKDGGHVSEDIKLYAEIIVSQVFKIGFEVYDRRDALLAYYCLNYC